MRSTYCDVSEVRRELNSELKTSLSEGLAWTLDRFTR